MTCISSARGLRRNLAAATLTCHRYTAAWQRLAPLLDRPCLVAGKSTVPVGTARGLAAELAAHRAVRARLEP